MQSEVKIGFAVVGCGHIGRRHADLIVDHPAARLVACCDLRSRAQLGLPDHISLYSHLDELLHRHPEADVISICTPNGLHATQALTALNARRHVVIEKPMALHRTDCEAIVHRALNVARQVFCVMQNRYSPATAWLKELVTQGRLGRIYQVQVDCYWNRDERYYRQADGRPHPWHGDPELDGGVLFTQFAHFIDLLYWVFGDIHDIRARFANARQLTPLADTGVVHFALERGGLGSLQFSTAVRQRNLGSSLTVVAQHGSLRIGGQYMNELEFCEVAGLDTPPDLPAAAPANQYPAGYQGSAANHQFVIQNVIDTLCGTGEISTNALEGMKVVDIIERIYAAGAATK